MTSRLCVPLQFSLPFRVCGLDFPFIFQQSRFLLEVVKMSAIKSLHLRLNFFRSLARDHHRKEASPNLTDVHTKVSFCAAHNEIRFQDSRKLAVRG